MKAAPEKIYLQQYDENTLICLNEWNISEEWSNKPRNEKISTNIEYTRTDVFIEKAENYLRNKCQRFILTEKDIEDFVKFMKGE